MARFSQGIAGLLYRAQTRRELPGLIKSPPQSLGEGCAF